MYCLCQFFKKANQEKVKIKDTNKLFRGKIIFSNKSNNLQALFEKFASNKYRKSQNPNPNDFFEGYLY